MTSSKSSHREACTRRWQELQTAWHGAHRGQKCTASHWGTAVRLVMGHDDTLQNVQKTRHQGGRQLT